MANISPSSPADDRRHGDPQWTSLVATQHGIYRIRRAVQGHRRCRPWQTHNARYQLPAELMRRLAVNIDYESTKASVSSTKSKRPPSR